MMNTRRLLIAWLLPMLILLFLIGFLVYRTDPFFHYRAPDTERYYYSIDNQRSQNDGILRHFDYDAIITGTSMTMNFKTSEADALFNVHSVKVPFAGARFHEINLALERAFSYNPKLKVIIRGLDSGSLYVMDAATDNLPSYLYDENSLNDINYLLNRDIFFGRTYEMILGRQAPGIPSFDEYSRWALPSGLNEATVDGIHVGTPGTPVHLTAEEEELLRTNISENVVSLAEAHPDTEFYYFLTPYSIIWWQSMVEDGTIYRQVEAERIACELILKCDNIHLFSFTCRPDIIADLNHYGDPIHYCHWINSLILRWMRDGSYQLTRDNYESRLEDELQYYLDFDYTSLADQPDYEDDLLAAAQTDPEFIGIDPTHLELHGDSVITDCSGYRYLVFSGKGLSSESSLSISLSDGNTFLTLDYADLEWTEHAVDISAFSNSLTVTFMRNDYLVRDPSLC